MPLSRIKPQMESGQLRLDSSAASTDVNERVLLNGVDSSSTGDGYAVILEDATDNHPASPFANVIIADSGTIGSVSDDDAIKINSSGLVTFGSGGITLHEGAMSQSVLQVIANSSAISGQGTTSTSYADITNATVAITPQNSNNKILIFWSGFASYALVSSTNVTYYQVIVRDTTVIKTSYYDEASGSGGLQGEQAGNAMVLDSPNTTSEVTYKVQHKVSSASSTGTTGGAGDQIVVMEIGVPS